jgi:protein-S-isoprenylcysteine O-methyltransferase Ste14
MTTDTHQYAERPSSIPWPPIIYAIAIVGGWLIQLVLPLPWFRGMAGELLFALGALLIAIGIAIDLTAMRHLHRARTTILPNRKAEHLVTAGIYGFSRNPIYLGNTILVFGAGLVSGIAWYILLAFIAAFIAYKLAISPEEHHLERRFGKAYRDYKKRVNRWF